MNQIESNPRVRPVVLVLSGPSGVGKDFVLGKLRARPLASSFSAIVTNTTRAMRVGELQDADYHFITLAEFQKMIDQNELLEYANVYGNWYGVPKEPVRVALAAGRDAIIKVDVQGAQAIKHAIPQAILVFLMPPSLDELARRLRKRNTEIQSDFSRRLKTAEEEMTKTPLFDYVIVNESGQVDQVVDKLETIVATEKLHVHPLEYNF